MSEQYIQELRDIRASIESGQSTIFHKIDEIKDMVSNLNGDQRVLRRDVDEQKKDLDNLFAANRDVTASHGKLDSEVRISMRNSKFILFTGVPLLFGVLKWIEHKLFGV